MPEWVAIVVDRGDDHVQQAVQYVRTLKPGTVVLCGGDREMDHLLSEEVIRNGLKILRYAPNRTHHGREAGMSRNRDLVDACDRLVAFHDGKGWGTASTIRYARSVGKPVEVIQPEPPRRED